MPTKPKDDTDTAAADAAIAEVDAEKMVTVTFNGKDYTFKRKRADAVQMRRFYQKRLDFLAVEFLLSEEQFGRFLEANADEDGCTSEDVYREFTKAISAAVGAGNS